MIDKQTQVVPLDAIIQSFVAAQQLPEGLAIAEHSYLLDPVEKQVVLTMTTVNSTAQLQAEARVKELEQQVKNLTPEEQVDLPEGS